MEPWQISCHGFFHCVLLLFDGEGHGGGSDFYGLEASIYGGILRGYGPLTGRHNRL